MKPRVWVETQVQTDVWLPGGGGGGGDLGGGGGKEIPYQVINQAVLRGGGGPSRQALGRESKKRNVCMYDGTTLL